MGPPLPTLAIIIPAPICSELRGTFQVYDSNKGRFADLGVLDVQQIFGRAGRPQFDSLGEAHIITTHDKLSRYLGMLTHSIPIESQFVKNLEDNLNAEVVLGTVSNLREAAAWLSYSYLFVRMTRNPLPYGLTYEDLAGDPELIEHRRLLLTNAAKVCASCALAFQERMF
jgi:activating signal cointegrator complex subunit 3